MVLKDWKKIVSSDVKLEWENQRDVEKSLMIIATDLRYPSLGWSMHFIELSKAHGLAMSRAKPFKNKRLALSAAQKYMRSH